LVLTEGDSFYIIHILTDNGLEFDYKFARGKNSMSGNHKFDIECTKVANSGFCFSKNFL